MEKVLEYIMKKGWEYKEVGKEYKISSGCPFCLDGKPDHFYISKTGLYNCKKCSDAGTLVQLQKKLGDYESSKLDVMSSAPYVKKEVTLKKIEEVQTRTQSKPQTVFDEKYVMDCHDALMKDEKVIDYFLNTRKFTKETLVQFKLGLNSKGRITIPIYEGGELVNVRERKNPFSLNENEPKYLSPAGGKLGMFNIDKLTREQKMVFLVEGEMDCISLTQASGGKAEVISGLIGASGFKDEWAKYFIGKKQVFICYDNDEPGQTGAEKVARKLGVQRSIIVNLPQNYNDVNDFFADGKTIADFKQLLSTSSRTLKNEDTGILKPISNFVNTVKKQIFGNVKVSGLDTGYPGLDGILKKMRPGDLVIVSGSTSAGKTWFCQNIVNNLARAGKAVMFFSLEMLPEEIVERFVMLDTGINSDSFSSGVSSLQPSDVIRIDDSLSKVSGYPIYFYDGKDTVDKHLLGEVSKKAVNEYGCELIVVDHLHYFANNSEDTAEISAIVRKAKEIARIYEVPVLMVCHIRKLPPGRKLLTIDDLRNSSLIGQDADIVMLLHRNRLSQDPLEKSLLFVNVDKNRHGREGRHYMNFSQDNCQITEIDYVHDQEMTGLIRLKENEMSSEDGSKGSTYIPEQKPAPIKPRPYYMDK